VFLTQRFHRMTSIKLIRRSLTALLLPVTLASTLILGIGAGPAVAWTSAPAACSYADVLTPHRAYADWKLSLLDTHYRLSSTYYPGDLVGTGISGGGYVRSLVYSDLHALASAAKAAGAPIAIQSAFRSYSNQVATFNYWVKVDGYAVALTVSARPGHSEHQLGTAIDFKSYGGSAPWNYSDWATTKAGAWMKANAWRYGFIMSYPKYQGAKTCYAYEPWHYRYVGRTEASAVHYSGLVLRYWLWRMQ
jgi:D-alanyl-D-alanine carboxypeptidase